MTLLNHLLTFEVKPYWCS